MNRPGNNPVIRGVLRPLFGSFVTDQGLLHILIFPGYETNGDGLPASNCEGKPKSGRIRMTKFLSKGAQSRVVPGWAFSSACRVVPPSIVSLPASLDLRSLDFRPRHLSPDFKSPDPE